MGKTSFQDLTGKKFFYLTVVRLYDRNKSGSIRWLCKCDCGNEVVVIGKNLKSGHTQSCGCYKSKRTIESHLTHGGRRTRLYNIYTGMKTRCYNSHCNCYGRYGGRGIKVCDEWLGKEGFAHFKEWSLNNGYSDGLSIDRIDVDKDYSPDNCRWADTFEQANNTTTSRYITINGVVKTAAEWERETGIKSSTIRYRIDHGMTPEEAITKDVTPCNEKRIEFKGEMITLTELGKRLGIDRRTLSYRLKHGIQLDKELKKHDR